MGFVALLRVLWRRRVLVAIGALIAIALGALALRQQPPPPSSSSHTEVFIDTPQSLVASARAPGSRTIYPRARLVAALLADDEAKAEIAHRAGLEPSELAVAGPGAAAEPLAITPLAEQAVEVAKPLAPYLVSVEVTPGLPIVSVDAHAPTRDAAVALGEAAVAVLPEVAHASPGGGNSVSVHRLGRAVVTTTAPGAGKTKLVAAFLFFCVWCLACIAFDRIARARRRGRPRLHPLEEGTG